MSLLAAVLLLLQEETTASFRPWTPQEGHRSTLKSEISVSTWVKLSKDAAARPRKTEWARSFEATQEILRLDGAALAKIRLSFAKATHRKNLWETPYGFQGTVLVVAYAPDAPRVFAYDTGRAVAQVDEDILRGAFMDRHHDRPRAAGGGEGGSPLHAPKPMAVGDACEVPPRNLAVFIAGETFAETVDLKASTATLAFKALETRAGVRTATLVCSGTFPLRRFEDLALETPIPARLTYALDLCVDGSRPDQKASVLIEVKGSSPVALPNGARVLLEVDNRTETRLSQQTLTQE